MSTSLHIGTGLSDRDDYAFGFPEDSLTRTFAVLAQRGAGKTYVAGVIEEEFAKHHLPFVVLDPVGVHYGIRSTVDGKRESPYPIVVFGGLHADIPLDEHMGDALAQAIVDENISCIIDLSELTKSAWRRFVRDFSRALYKKNTSPRHVFIEEATEFVPQTRRPEMNESYEAVERMIRLGRNRGLGTTLIAQRAAQIAKDVLYALDVLIVLRTVGTLDRKAIIDLLEENVGEEERDLVKEMKKTMPSLPNGRAWVWSPQFLKCFTQVNIRSRETYHGGATPTFEKTKLVQAKPDVTALRERLAPKVELKEADPEVLSAIRGDTKETKQLRGVITELREQNSSLKQENEQLAAHQKRMMEELTTLRQDASSFQTIRSLLSVGPVQTTVVYGDGDAPPPIDRTEILQTVLQQFPKLAQLDELVGANYGGGVTVTPPEALRKKYLDQAVDRVFQKIGQVDEPSRRIIEVLLSNPKFWPVTSISKATTGQDGGSGWESTKALVGNLFKAGFITRGGQGGGQYKENIEGLVRSELSTHSPSDDEVQSVLQHVISRLVSG